MYRKDVDIGSIIRRIVDEKMKVAEFARRLYPNPKSKSRSAVYSIFKSKSIDTDKLIEISNILNYPFLLEYSEERPVTRQILQIETDPSKIEEILTEFSKDKTLIITKLRVID